MAWRLARSLVQLRNEIRAAYPGTTVWDIGDQSHASGASDHNPNSAGVVCAIDVLGDEGLDLGWFAEALKESGDPRLKYVIFNRRIWSRERDSEGWRYYGGPSPHDHHCHVSVGRGSDGHSTGPYDDGSPWGIFAGVSIGGENLIGLSKGDSGDAVEALQYMLRRAGFNVGHVDGDYGPKTSAAVLAMRKSLGSAAQDGDRITGAAYDQLMAAFVKEVAGGAVVSYLPKLGDKGVEVEYWSRVLVGVGALADKTATYDDDMKEAVSTWYAQHASGSYDGDRITSWIADELLKEHYKGEKGDPGEPGKDGKDGVLTGQLKLDGVVEAHPVEGE